MKSSTRILAVLVAGAMQFGIVSAQQPQPNDKEPKAQQKQALKDATIQLPEVTASPANYVDRILRLKSAGLGSAAQYTKKDGSVYFLASMLYFNGETRKSVRTPTAYVPNGLVFMVSPEMAAEIRRLTPGVSGPGFDIHPAGNVWFKIHKLESNGSVYYIGFVDCIEFLGGKPNNIGSCQH